jgi:hypothetical protein
VLLETISIFQSILQTFSTGSLLVIPTSTPCEQISGSEHTPRRFAITVAMNTVTEPKLSVSGGHDDVTPQQARSHCEPRWRRILAKPP